jgi:hypothetical protein
VGRIINSPLSGIKILKYGNYIVINNQSPRGIVHEN